MRFFKLPSSSDDRMQIASYILRYLRICRVWNGAPLEPWNLLRFALFYTFNLLPVFGFWAQMTHYVWTTPSFSYAGIAESAAVSMAALTSFNIYLPFYFRQCEVRELLNTLAEHPRPLGIERNDAIMNMLGAGAVIMVLAAVPLLFAVYVFDDCTAATTVLEDFYTCGLIYPLYVPGMMTPIGRKILLAVQLASAGLLSASIFGAHWVYMHISEALVMYCKQLQRMIRELPEVVDRSERHRRVRDLVLYHYRIISLHWKFALLVRNPLLTHVTISPVVLAMLLYVLAMHMKFSLLMQFNLWIQSILMVCIIGQRIVNESLQIADVAYDSIPWDDDTSTAHAFVLIMLRSQRALYLPAGRLAIFGHTVFVAIVKATYSYWTLLHTGKNNN